MLRVFRREPATEKQFVSHARQLTDLLLPLVSDPTQLGFLKTRIEEIQSGKKEETVYSLAEIYLLLETYLIEVEQSGQFTRDHFHQTIKDATPHLLDDPALGLVFETPEIQAHTLAGLFLDGIAASAYRLFGQSLSDIQLETGININPTLEDGLDRLARRSGPSRPG